MWLSLVYLLVARNMAFFRFITFLVSEEIDVDLRTLRAIRVLRPLKLVSGIPSKYMSLCNQVYTLQVNEI